MASMYTEQKEFEITSNFQRIKANMCLSQNISLPHKYKHAVMVFRDTLSHMPRGLPKPWRYVLKLVFLSHCQLLNITVFIYI